MMKFGLLIKLMVNLPLYRHIIMSIKFAKRFKHHHSEHTSIVDTPHYSIRPDTSSKKTKGMFMDQIVQQQSKTLSLLDRPEKVSIFMTSPQTSVSLKRYTRMHNFQTYRPSTPCSACKTKIQQKDNKAAMDEVDYQVTIHPKYVENDIYLLLGLLHQLSMVFQIVYLTGLVVLILVVFKYLFFNKNAEGQQKDQGNGRASELQAKPQTGPDIKNAYPGSNIMGMEQEGSDSSSEMEDSHKSPQESQENEEVSTSEKHQDEKVQENNENIDKIDEEIQSVYLQVSRQNQQTAKINNSEKVKYEPQLDKQPLQQQKPNEDLEKLQENNPLNQIQQIISQQDIIQLQNYEESIRVLAAQLQQQQKLCQIDTQQIITSMEVKDVISQCQEQSYVVEEIISQAEKIEILEAPLKKSSKRLKAVKDHYKSIIDELKRKLEELCIRHNESLEDINMNQTVTFSQEESMSFLEEQSRGQLEVKVEEVTSLKNQLQLHEEIITNLIEEDGKLKDKLRNLQLQNQNLKSVLSSSAQLKQQQKHNQQKLVQSRQYQDQVIQSNPNSKVDQLLCKSGFKNSAAQSRIIQLYTSQIISPSYNNSITSSQIFPKQSMISMMSAVVQGALSIGMLGQCRFLNQISKKFAIGEVKKCRRRKVNDAELVYSYSEENQTEAKEAIYPIIRGMKNLLFLMKLSSHKNIGIFTEEIYDEEHPVQEEVITKLLFLDLSKRKGYPQQSTCRYQENQLFFGQNSLFLTQSPPFKIRRLDQQLSPLLDDETQKISFLAIHHLTLQSNQ